MSRLIKKIISMTLCIILCLSLLPLGRMTAYAVDPVEYLDKDGNTQSCADYIRVNSDNDQWYGSKWYVVIGEVTIDHTVPCDGSVHLILTDGCVLNVTGSSGDAGIRVEGSVTIYGQANGTGKLTATGGFGSAGIGGKDGENSGAITINGGMITANGGNQAAGIGGGNGKSGSVITINGGTVNAAGGPDGAGIGGGYSGGNSGGSGSGEIIEINGGMITANGGNQAAGIGGGNGGKGENIEINGGTVNAKGGLNGAGIGGGLGGDGSIIAINGGAVTASGGDFGAGIGGGQHGNGVGITIKGGTLDAKGGKNAAGIGGGGTESDNGGSGSYIGINGGTVNAKGGLNGAGIGGGLGGDGSDIAINGGAVTASGGENAAGIGHGGSGGGGARITVTSSTDYTTKHGDSSADTLIDSDGRASEFAGSTQRYFEMKEKVHSWTYEVSADGKTIKAGCRICHAGLDSSLELVPPSSVTYDGSAKQATAVPSESWTDNSLTAGTVKYRTWDGTAYVYETDTAPVNAGKYKASVTAGTATASVEFTIDRKKAELGFRNTVFTYDGNEHIPEAYVSNLADGDSCSVTVTGAKTNAGTHTVTATALSDPNYRLPDTCTGSFTIKKADPATPTDLTASEGGTLADVKLPEGFAWVEDGRTVLDKAGTFTFHLKYTPSDAGNYNPAESIEVKVTVTEAPKKSGSGSGSGEPVYIGSSKGTYDDLWIEGDNQQGRKPEDIGRFRVNVDFSKFREVYVDGRMLTVTEYKAYSGSTVVELSESFLETLSDGMHRLSIRFTDGTADTNFYMGNEENPNTGAPEIIGIPAGTAVVLIAAAAIRKYKR